MPSWHRPGTFDAAPDSMNKTDIQLKQDVEAELQWDRTVDAAEVGVSVESGAVSLRGEVDSYAAKWAAIDATKRVAGVRAVVEDLTVKLPGTYQHSDSEIAQAAATTLTWDVRIPRTVTAKVENGWLTLEGNVEWNYQREAAGRAVRYLLGVVGVTNAIGMTADASSVLVEESVKAALQRQATSDANTILIGTSGGTVTLKGRASSWQAIEDAAAAAWAAPGVTKVIDTVVMSPV